jgi:dTDP-4-dehydrorhamnose 3,5-epimerase
MFQKIETNLPGVVVVKPRVFEDERGAFVKTYHTGFFRDMGLELEPKEAFFTVSRKGVIRGMHFQMPPSAYAKLVYCIVGSILDVVVDLRRSSGCYGSVFSREISGVNHEMIFIPVGCAHGFLALEDGAIVVYQTSTMHDPARDLGILWFSIDFAWGVDNPVVSARDKAHPKIAEFESPF